MEKIFPFLCKGSGRFCRICACPEEICLFFAFKMQEVFDKLKESVAEPIPPHVFSLDIERACSTFHNTEQAHADITDLMKRFVHVCNDIEILIDGDVCPPLVNKEECWDSDEEDPQPADPFVWGLTKGSMQTIKAALRHLRHFLESAHTSPLLQNCARCHDMCRTFVQRYLGMAHILRESSFFCSECDFAEEDEEEKERLDQLLYRPIPRRLNNE